MPTSIRRSGPPNASRAATGSFRSRPRSPAKWFRVPDGTHTNGTSPSTATLAASPSDPSPPATPTALAPAATAARASSTRSSPASSTCTRIPRARAASTSPTRPAFPSPERGFTTSQGTPGAGESPEAGGFPPFAGAPEPAHRIVGAPAREGSPAGEGAAPAVHSPPVPPAPAPRVPGPARPAVGRRARRAAVAYVREPMTMAAAPAAWRKPNSRKPRRVLATARAAMTMLSQRFQPRRVVNTHQAVAAITAALRTVPTSSWRSCWRLPATTWTRPAATTTSEARAARAHHLGLARPGSRTVIRSLSRTSTSRPKERPDRQPAFRRPRVLRRHRRPRLQGGVPGPPGPGPAPPPGRAHHRGGPLRLGPGAAAPAGPRERGAPRRQGQGRRGGLRPPVGPAALHRRRLRRRPHLPAPAQGPRRRPAAPAVPGHPAEHVRHRDRGAGRRRLHRRRPGGGGEAVRPRPGLGPRAQPDPPPPPARGADLPHGPLPRQGADPEHPLPALRQRPDGADLERPLHPPDADHHGRGLRGPGPGRLLRGGRGDPRRPPEPPAPGARPAGHGRPGRAHP